ncbi:hypothetical protein Sinac_5262 [Singulisphaera acidiphila DSM 18658]|uniref:Uncharacterized protein n=1 Tax=Singulisphaera acidiphila (strain ATCC BAA-1392 / DSM 18658 / VKM B-2454 / MOB10) TaxID=886293 RepID=L0DKP3_SINAD|nr:hypothetical protein Sinac_5262 [Singulisphaera acidiphila DSM 18658]
MIPSGKWLSHFDSERAGSVSSLSSVVRFEDRKPTLPACLEEIPQGLQRGSLNVDVALLAEQIGMSAADRFDLAGHEVNHLLG